MTSTSNISNFVTTKLWFKYPDQNNYQAWKQQMICMLDSNGLLGMIDGSGLELINGDPQPVQVMIWRRKRDVLVKGWILSACSDDVVSVVATKETARDVWLELERMSKQYQLSIISPSASGVVNVHQDATGCEWVRHLPLKQAVAQGDWDKTMQIFAVDENAKSAELDVFGSTALHIAVGTGQTVEFLNMLVDEMSDEIIAQPTVQGDTALSIAAALGNKEAVTFFLQKMPGLLYVPNKQEDFPVQIAAKYAQKDVLDYLISVMDENHDNRRQDPYDGSAGIRLLVNVIDADFFDTACALVEDHPYLAKHTLPNNVSALKKLAEKKWEFSSRKRKGLMIWIDIWKRSFPTTARRTMGNQRPPNLAEILVEMLCNMLKDLSTPEEALEIYYDAMLTAAQSGATYVAEVIEKTFPDSTCSSMDAHISVVRVAIQNRSLDILELIYGKCYHRHLYADWVDFESNNLLHLAAKLTPDLKIKAHPNAAFQMQRELRWYQGVKALIDHPAFSNRLNKDGKTPWMVFREEHMDMKVEGEKWLKDTANSHIIVTALIATVTFAAAITVPGGTNSKGFPVFSKEVGFYIFSISDLLSLCFSVTSLIDFLMMSTTQDIYEAFLTFHPLLLDAGIRSLYLSLLCMMIAFVAVGYLVFQKHSIWIPILATFCACGPVIEFLTLREKLSPFMQDVVPVGTSLQMLESLENIS